MTDVSTELAGLRREIDALKARASIQEQLTRYARGLEWLDVSLVNEFFWEDAEIDFGFFRGVWRDYRPILMAMEKRAPATYHLMAAPQLEFEGSDIAHVECYGIALGSGGEEAQLYGGRYFLRFERRSGAWRSARCAYVLDWRIRGVDAGAISGPLGAINRVTDRSPNHPWFRRMGQNVTG